MYASMVNANGTLFHKLLLSCFGRRWVNVFSSMVCLQQSLYVRLSIHLISWLGGERGAIKIFHASLSHLEE